MDEEVNIRLKSSEGDIFEFRSEFQNLSKLVHGLDPTDVIAIDVKSEVLRVIKKFCEIHNYKEETMVTAKPLKSAKLADNIDSLSYQIMQDYACTQNVEDQGKTLQGFIYAAYHLDFQKFKEICLTMIGTPFYVGETDAEIDSFKKKWNLGEISPEEERQIISNNLPVFESISQAFEEKMKQEQETYLEYFKKKAE